MAEASYRLPREVAGVRIPDSDVARKATRLAFESSPQVVFNHVLRTYVFGALVARRQATRFDEELFYLSAVLHDLGLTKRFGGLDRFEVAGADAADAFLADAGVSESRREVVWDAIALHTSVGIANRKRAEIALVHIGAGIDVVGLQVDSLPAGLVEQTLAALPRLDFKTAFLDILLGTVADNPQGAMMTWLSETARTHLHAYPCPSFVQALQSAPFEE